MNRKNRMKSYRKLERKMWVN